MSGFGLYLRNTFADCLRSNSLVQSATASALWLRARCVRGNPTRRLALLARAAHVSPVGGGLNRRLCAAIRSELEKFAAAAVDWNAVGGGNGRTDIPKAIILKPPVSREIGRR